MQRLGKHVPVAKQQILNNATARLQQWKRGVSTCPVLVESTGEFYTGGCEERTWARETEESPLLEAVARKRLVKPQQAGKRLEGAVFFAVPAKAMQRVDYGSVDSNRKIRKLVWNGRQPGS
jgi:hypothetical protein